jgi:hypothetical protein
MILYASHRRSEERGKARYHFASNDLDNEPYYTRAQKFKHGSLLHTLHNSFSTKECHKKLYPALQSGIALLLNYSLALPVPNLLRAAEPY